MNALLQGRYEIIRTLSDAGGFGETFLAVDRQLPSQRKCVIKKFRPKQRLDARTYEIVRERFEREAAVLETLSDVCHQVPKLYAFFSEAGEYYLVQEFIEGQTLGQFVRVQGRLDEVRTRQLLASLLQALHEIHAQGIIHRDIKPDNILLRISTGQPVLIDFGAVKEIITTVLDAYGTPQKASLIIGTPGYTPVEQSVGRPVYGSDLYSLAMTMIFALTGREPHDLNDLASGELQWRGHTGQLSNELCAVLERAAQYDYRDRYKTAREMLDALNTAQPAKPVMPPVRPAPVQPPTVLDPVTVQPATVQVDPTTIPRLAPQPPSKPQPALQPVPAPPRGKVVSRRSMLLALSASGVALVATTVYLSNRESPANPATAPVATPTALSLSPPAIPARAEVLRYVIQREPAPGQGFSFLFTPRAAGYLYLIGFDEKTQPQVLLSKVRLAGGKEFEVSSWYSFTAGKSAASFTVILAPQPLAELPFLNRPEHILGPDEAREWESWRARFAASAPQTREQAGGVSVTAQKRAEEPLVLELTVKR